MSSSIKVENNLCADVHLVPMFSENYGILLVDRKTKHTICVDPGDGKHCFHLLKYFKYIFF
jgi:hypothetical protein